MKKLLVRTTGGTQLIATGGQVLTPHRPHVVEATPFISARTASGGIEVLLSKLTDTTSDDDFLTFWKEDSETAVDQYELAMTAEMTKPEEVKYVPPKVLSRRSR